MPDAVAEAVAVVIAVTGLLDRLARGGVGVLAGDAGRDRLEAGLRRRTSS